MKALKESDAERHKRLCTQIREDGAYVEAGENDNLLIQSVSAESRARSACSATPSSRRIWTGCAASRSTASRRPPRRSALHLSRRAPALHLRQGRASRRDPGPSRVPRRICARLGAGRLSHRPRPDRRCPTPCAQSAAAIAPRRSPADERGGAAADVARPSSSCWSLGLGLRRLAVGARRAPRPSPGRAATRPHSLPGLSWLVRRAVGGRAGACSSSPSGPSLSDRLVADAVLASPQAAALPAIDMQRAAILAEARGLATGAIASALQPAGRGAGARSMRAPSPSTPGSASPSRLLLAFAGGAFAFTRLSPDFRARTRVERIGDGAAAASPR